MSHVVNVDEDFNNQEKENAKESNNESLYAEGTVEEECQSDREITIDKLHFCVTEGTPKIEIEGLEMSGKFKETACPLTALLTEFRD